MPSEPAQCAGWRSRVRIDSSELVGGCSNTQPTCRFVVTSRWRAASAGVIPSRAATSRSDSPSAHDAPGTHDSVTRGQTSSRGGSRDRTAGSARSASVRSVSASGSQSGRAASARIVAAAQVRVRVEREVEALGERVVDQRPEALGGAVVVRDVGADAGRARQVEQLRERGRSPVLVAAHVGHVRPAAARQHLAQRDELRAVRRRRRCVLEPGRHPARTVVEPLLQQPHHRRDLVGTRRPVVGPHDRVPQGAVRDEVRGVHRGRAVVGGQQVRDRPAAERRVRAVDRGEVPLRVLGGARPRRRRARTRRRPGRARPW